MSDPIQPARNAPFVSYICMCYAAESIKPGQHFYSCNTDATYEQYRLPVEIHQPRPCLHCILAE